MIIILQTWSGQYFFYTAHLTTIARSAGFVEKIMSPFPSYSMAAVPYLAVKYNSTAYTCSHNYSKNHAGVRCLFFYDTPLCFGECKTIGIVSHFNRNT